MAGRHVNDGQARQYMRHRKDGLAVETAAAKAGFSRATGYRLEGDSRLPSEKRKRRGSRRPDPLGGLFERVAAPLLERNPGLRAVAVFEELRRLHPELPASTRRTVERRVREWKAVHGPEREVVFVQKHRPGRRGYSDFTAMAKLGVTVAGEPLPHLLYRFRLPYSGFEHARVVLGGESWTALAEGLQEALWALGGVPEEHRTDSLSAAFGNLSKDAVEDQTRGYEELCAHYGMTPTRNNRGRGHENGVVESSHGHFKRALADALMLRGSREFESVQAYRDFVAAVVARRNARRSPERIEAESRALRPLPRERVQDFRETRVRVTRSGGFTLGKVFYTLPSQMIGHVLTARVYDDRIELYLGAKPYDVLARVRPGKGKRARGVNYRHVIRSLQRKPMALKDWVHRDQLFPRDAYRRVYDEVTAKHGDRRACRVAVALLALAHEQGCERALAERIDAVLDAGGIPDPKALASEFAMPEPSVLDIGPAVREGSLDGYDRLFDARNGNGPAHGPTAHGARRPQGDAR